MIIITLGQDAARAAFLLPAGKSGGLLPNHLGQERLWGMWLPSTRKYTKVRAALGLGPSAASVFIGSYNAPVPGHCLVSQAKSQGGQHKRLSGVK